MKIKNKNTTLKTIALVLSVAIFFVWSITGTVSAASVAVDTFVRGGGESSPYPLQSHTASNGSTWTKSAGSEYRLVGASGDVKASASGIVTYYNNTTVATDGEVGVKVNKGTSSGSYNYIAPIVRSNAAGTAGVWAEMDLSQGTVGLRQIYSPYVYLTPIATGFTFGTGDYYVVIGVVGTTYSMYVKDLNTGMWLNGTSKAFDSASRIAVVTATGTQNGTYVGVGGYTSSTGSPKLMQVDIGSAGDLLAPASLANTAPAAPQTVTVSGGDTQASLSWIAPTSDGGSAITQYKVYNSPANTVATTTTGTTASITGLTNGVSYSYYVTAVNIVGESASSAVVSVTPQTLTVAGAPQSFVASAGDQQVALSWTAPVSNGGSTITQYKVYNATSNTLALTTTGTTGVVTGLTNGVSYSYYVTAVNAIGESIASSVSTATPRGLITIPVTDTAFVSGLSPYVWYKGSGYITSAGGSNAYFKTGFSGSVFGITVDVSSQVAASMNAIAYPVLKYRIDGGAYQTVQLTSTSTTVLLAEGISSGNHTIEAHYQRNMYYDSWNTPIQQLKITGVVVGEGEALSAFPIASKKMLVYGDSITEGQWIQATSSGNTGQSGQGALIADSTRVYITQLAANLGAEFGNTAVGGQGWTGGGLTNVPGLTSSWDLYSAGRSRLVGGKIASAPDYVFINMGTNGGVSSTAIVTDWLTSLRAALPASSIIYLTVPFNGTGRTNITSGFNTYMASKSSFERTYLIDLGTISGYTTTDGLHPNGAGNDVVAGLLTSAINAITIPAQTFTVTGSDTGISGVPATFTVTPNGVYSGTVTLTPAGGNVSDPIVVTFSNSATPQTFTVTPTSAGTVTFTATNSGSLENAAPFVYTVSANSSAVTTPGVYGYTPKIFIPVTNATPCLPGDLFNSVTGTRCSSNTLTNKPSLSIAKTLRFGMSDPQVLLLQQYLNNNGFYIARVGAGSPGKETAYFGLNTKKAVMKFQKAKRIFPVDGIAGLKTRKALSFE